MLYLKGDAVVARSIVSAEERDARRDGRQCKVADVFVATILMHTLLMFVMNVQSPCRTQHTLDAKAKLQGVRSVIVRVNNRALIAGCQQAAERFVDCPESIDPSILI